MNRFFAGFSSAVVAAALVVGGVALAQSKAGASLLRLDCSQQGETCACTAHYAVTPTDADLATLDPTSKVVALTVPTCDLGALLATLQPTTTAAAKKESAWPETVVVFPEAITVRP